MFLYISVCPTEVGGMFVAKDYCRPITDQTPISHLLPTTKEAGLCSYALLDYLTRKQNDFLDKYMQESKRFVMKYWLIYVCPSMLCKDFFGTFCVACF